MRHRSPYVPALDGLRAVAVLAVLISHSWTVVMPGGWVGVDIFFVLSGYLITSILLTEMGRTGRISLLDFYRRRALRLLPASFAAVGLALVVATATHALRDTAPQALATIAYVANWRLASGAPGGMLGHTWSLSVEEQFYLCWPLLLIGLLRLGGRRTALLAALIGLALLALDSLNVPSAPAYFRTDTRGAALLLGCAVALAAAQGVFARMRDLPLTLGAIAGGLILLAGARALTIGGHGGADTYTIVDLAAAALIVRVVERPGLLARLLATRPMVWVGRRSYGIYLYGLILAHLGADGPVHLVVIVGLTMAVAAVSYRYLELPFLRLKDRRVAAPAGMAAVAA